MRALLKAVLDIGALIARLIMVPVHWFNRFFIMAALALVVSVVTVSVPSVFYGISSLVESVATAFTARPATVRQSLDANRLAQAQVTKVEREALQGQAERLARQSALDQVDLTILRSERDQLAATVGTLERRAARTATDLASSRLRNAQIASAATDTFKRIGVRTQIGAARNISAMYGESIPFWGIGVIVAATTWEIADACHTMEDLYALNVLIDPAAKIDTTEVCGLRVPTGGEIWQVVKSSPQSIAAAASGTFDSIAETKLPGWVTRSIDAMAFWGSQE